MADTLTHSSPAPVTEDAFIADRQRFWGGFTTFTLVSTIALVILIVLMAIFLV